MIFFSTDEFIPLAGHHPHLKQGLDPSRDPQLIIKEGWGHLLTHLHLAAIETVDLGLPLDFAITQGITMEGDHIEIVEILLIEWECRIRIDHVVVIHLFQGEVEAGAQALEQESPTEMIQARQNVA